MGFNIRELQANFPIATNDLLKYSAAIIAFNPTFWNVVGRFEFKTHILRKIFGSKKIACFIFAITVFSLGIIRDLLFHEVLRTQPNSPVLQNDLVHYAGAVIAVIGQAFNLSSMWALGVTGTYLGDYFGILMDKKVEGFPFSVINNPMYVGSSLTFLGTALYYGKAAGVVLSLWVWIVYKIGLLFEEPFTDKIYSNREKYE